jgi:hypothetical protein
VSHCGLAIYIKKYLKAEEELWKLKYFTMQKYNLQTNPLQETKIFQDIIPLQLISSFKNPQIKIDLLPRGQNALSYYAL